MRISDWSSDVCSSDLVFDAHALDHLELLFEFVDMMFLAFEDVGEEVAADIVAHALAMGNGVLEQRDRLFLDREVGLEDFLDRFADAQADEQLRSEEHTSELQSLIRTSYAVFCLKKNNTSQSRKDERSCERP